MLYLMFCCREYLGVVYFVNELVKVYRVEGFWSFKCCEGCFLERKRGREKRERFIFLKLVYGVVDLV